MSEKKRPLPEPPTSAFGLRSRFQENEDPSLMADDIARAAAEGRLEELFGKEIPDNEQARALVSMMMGMTGMSSFAGPAKETGENVPPKETEAVSPPEEVLRAVEGGDVAGLIGLLKKEQSRRSADAGQTASPEGTEREGGDTVSGRPAIEKEVIDGLIRIASDNEVTLDWLILRALKVYVRQYRDTGRL